MTSQKPDSDASVCSMIHASFFTGRSAMTFTALRRPVQQRALHLAQAEAAARARVVQAFAPGAKQITPDRRTLRGRREPVQLEEPVAAVREEERLILA